MSQQAKTASQTVAPVVIGTFPLRGASLIEASAGTGKTYTIALLYLRLILGHGGSQGFERPLLPPEILVVTFTKAASMELRDRIRARLTEAAQVFAGEKTLATGDPLQAIVQDYPASQHVHCASLLRQAAEWMDEAAVSTIHSWCYRMLREHAFDSGSLFDNELVQDHGELWAEVAADFWRRQLYGGDVDELLARWLFDAIKTPEALLKKTQSLRGAEAQAVYNGECLSADFQQTKQQFIALLQKIDVEQQRLSLKNSEVRALFKQHWDEVAEQFQQSWEGLSKQTYKETCDEVLQQFEQWIKDGEDFEKIENYTAEKLAEKTKKKFTPPMHPALEALGDYIRDKQSLAALGNGDASKKQQQAFFWAAMLELEQLFEQRLLQRAELGNDELLSRLQRALARDDSGRLSTAIRQQFPVVFIDEFQDTDPVQYGIFNAIYQLDKQRQDSCLVLIGDPKQAIYAFRGADIFTYLQARAATFGHHYNLAKNFRATHALVGAVNRVFERVERTAPLAAFRLKQQAENPVPFLAVDSQGRSERLELDGEALPPVVLWHLLDDEAPLASKHYRSVMAEAAAEQVSRWLNAAQRSAMGFVNGETFTALQPSDIALLVRTGTEAALLKQALAERGVASVYLSARDSVFDSTEASDLFLWLQALIRPRDERALRTALATESLQLELAEIEEMIASSHRWETLLGQFRAYAGLWRSAGVLPVLHRLLHDFSAPERLLALWDGERRMTNILHLAEWLQQASTRIEGEAALLRHFAAQLGNSVRVREEQVLRLESDENLVRIVTIHKSKGLEYPLVMLPFISGARPVKKQDTLRYHQWPAGESPQAIIDLGDSEESRQRADEERLAEDLRLLYVALTRARHALVLGVACLKNQGNEKRSSLVSAFNYLAGFENGVCGSPDQLAAALDALSKECGWSLQDLPDTELPSMYCAQEPAAIGAARCADLRFEPWWVASYSSLQYKSLYTDVVDSAAWELQREESQQQLPALQAHTQLSGWHALPRGAHTGSFLHTLFERCIEFGLAEAVANTAWRQRMLAQLSERYGFADYLEQIDQGLLRWLTTPLAVAGDSLVLAQLDADQLQAEFEFWFGSYQVETSALDQLIRNYTLAGAARPTLVQERLNGVLNGFIDLVFCHGQRYYLLDWKSNTLGNVDADYQQKAMVACILQHRYDLQYSLYLLALHRLLRHRLPNYDYDRDVGGVIYLFLRAAESAAEGCGVYFDKPPKAMIEALDALFDGQLPIAQKPMIQEAMTQEQMIQEPES